MHVFISSCAFMFVAGSLLLVILKTQLALWYMVYALEIACMYNSNHGHGPVNNKHNYNVLWGSVGVMGVSACCFAIIANSC